LTRVIYDTLEANSTERTQWVDQYKLFDLKVLIHGQLKFQSNLFLGPLIQSIFQIG